MGAIFLGSTVKLLGNSGGQTMIKSKFDKKGSFKATKVFTDRADPRHLFRTSVSDYCEGTLASKLLVFYGFGGIGKTKLLHELLTNDEYYPLEYIKDIRKIFISLDVYDYSNPIPVLMNIRRQIDEKCYLFDYALLDYYHKIGVSFNDTLSKFDKINDTFFDIISDAISIGLGDVTIPVKYIKLVGEKILNKRSYKKYHEYIAEIEHLNEFEIYERLPHYLGLEISRQYKDNKPTIVFLDSYESILLKMKDSAVCEDSEEWLKEFFISSSNILIVIGSREKIKWEEDDEEWGDYLDQHILEKLSPNDSKYFLERVPVNEYEIVNTMIQSANGIPLFLDMCVDLYSQNLNNSINNCKEFFDIKTDKIIGRYLRHMRSDEKYLTKHLAIYNFFDVSFVEYLIGKLNIKLNSSEIDEYLSKSIFLMLDSDRYKIDDGVKAHIKKQIDPKIYNKGYNTLIAYIANEMSIYSELYIPYFEHIILLITSYKINTDRDDIELIIDIINKIIDTGYWNELNTVIEKYKTNLSVEYPEIYVYSKIRHYRRTGKLQDGIELLNSAIIDKDLLGKHLYQYKFLEVHFYHLIGDYDYALKQYKLTIDKFRLIKHIVDKDVYYMFNIKYADLLMLKGRFKTALGIIEQLLENDTLSTKVLTEALRVKGHIFRFNFMLVEAETVYSSIFSVCKSENLNVIGKVYNNILECRCWYDPRSAIEYSSKSIEINERIGASLELGKTYTSLGIAYVKNLDVKDSYKYIDKAITIQKQCDYKSGVLFGMVAKYIALSHEKVRNEDAICRLFDNIEKLSNQLNVYKFLLVPLRDNIDEYAETFEWIDFDYYKEKAKDMLLGD